MPTFDFTSPEGKVYSVEGPEGATQAQAFEILQAQIGAPKPAAAPSAGIGEDLMGVAKAAPGRLVAGLAGIPGDLLHLGMRALGDNLTPESNYGTRAIARSLGSDYEAKGEPGRIAQKVIDFAPAVIGGPEAIAAKLLTRVAAPVATSEVGRAVGGPIGEVAGALGGAAGASMAAQRFNAAAKARTAVPTGEELLKTGSTQFDDARNMNLVVKPDFAQATAADMRAALKDFDPQDASVKDVFRKIDRLDNMGVSSPGLPPVALEMNEVENVRKQLSKLRMSQDASTREAAKKAQEVLTRNQMAIAPADVIAGDAAAYTGTMRDAVGNYGAGKRSNVVTGKLDLAELNTNTAGSGANGDNAMRQAMKQLARPINNTNTPVAKRLGFNDPEIAAIKSAATGTGIGNAARYLGKLAPTGSVSGVLSGGAGFAAAGPLGAIGLPAAGYLAKKIGDLSTKKAVAALDSLVRSRSPLAKQVAAQLPPLLVNRLPASSKLLLGSAAIQPLATQQPAQQRSY